MSQPSRKAWISRMGTRPAKEGGGSVMTDFEEKQALMIHSGLTKGLTHPETIRISQELDDLLNELMKQSSNLKKHSETKN